MPTIAENQRIWGHDYSWPQQRDEWSDAWGTVASQWFCTVLPRIYRFVPCETILEKLRRAMDVLLPIFIAVQDSRSSIGVPLM